MSGNGNPANDGSANLSVRWYPGYLADEPPTFPLSFQRAGEYFNRTAKSSHGSTIFISQMYATNIFLSPAAMQPATAPTNIYRGDAPPLGEVAADHGQRYSNYPISPTRSSPSVPLSDGRHPVDSPASSILAGASITPSSSATSSPDVIPATPPSPDVDISDFYERVRAIRASRANGIPPSNREAGQSPQSSPVVRNYIAEE